MPADGGAAQREAQMLKLLPIQPPEAPAKHEALVSLAGYRDRLEKCPDDRNGDWHEAATAAWIAMLQIERMVSQLLDIANSVSSKDASEAIDHAIDVLVESAATVTVDAVNGAFYRAIDAANMRRGY